MIDCGPKKGINLYFLGLDNLQGTKKIGLDRITGVTGNFTLIAISDTCQLPSLEKLRSTYPPNNLLKNPPLFLLFPILASAGVLSEIVVLLTTTHHLFPSLIISKSSFSRP
jgi:hypothetical protein